jgi:hypothetical protein
VQGDPPAAALGARQRIDAQMAEPAREVHVAIDQLPPGSSVQIARWTDWTDRG